MGKQLVVILLLSVFLTGCGADRSDDVEDRRTTAAEEENIIMEESKKEEPEEAEIPEISEAVPEQKTETEDTEAKVEDAEAGNENTGTDIVNNETIDTEEAQDNMINIQIGDTVLTGELCENSSADALKELLAKGPLTIEMSDYGNFEKVGPIGETLPRNDEQITTEPGDIILYQGTNITIYYDTNSWNFTRLGKVTGVTKEELKKVLGTGSVEVTFTLP